MSRMQSVQMQSVLDKLTAEHLHDEPFPYAHATRVLDSDCYQELAEHFPDTSCFSAGLMQKNNFAEALSGVAAFDDQRISPVWRDFMTTHLSGDFFRQVVSYLGPHIRSHYPDLETRLGKSLDDLTTQCRDDNRTADVMIDCQFVVTSPTVTPSRVRAVHIDNPQKLYSALLYMREDDDTSTGAELCIYRFRDEPRFQSVNAKDDDVELVETVKYESNAFVLMLNTLNSLHGVSERQPTRHVRRYINFLAEFREPLFDLEAHQETQTPWALFYNPGA